MTDGVQQRANADWAHVACCPVDSLSEGVRGDGLEGVLRHLKG